MRTLLLACTLALASTGVVADDKAEWKALDGTWTVEKMLMNGTDQTALLKDGSLVIDSGKYTFTVKGTADKGTIALNATKKTMDITGSEGVNKGKTYLALYEVKEGVLTVAYGLDEKTRPAKLDSSKDSNIMLVTYKKK
jgi:uncharacterized protein (TIGR03067 family)